MTQILKFLRRVLPLGLTLIALVGSAFLPEWLSPLFWTVGEAERISIIFENILAASTVFIAGAAFVITNHDLQNAHATQERCEVLRNALKSVGDDYFDIWRNILSISAAELNFSASERISVYKHSGSSFLMLGRYSLNSQFARRGRASYPDTEGCIGAAWRSANGRCFTNQLPDASQAAAYESAQHGAWGLPPAVTRGLTMKSRSIAAFCVLNATGTQRQAIVVFESTRPRRLAEDRLLQYLEDKGFAQIVLMMDALKYQEPSLELAKKEGFG